MKIKSKIRRGVSLCIIVLVLNHFLIVNYNKKYLKFFRKERMIVGKAIKNGQNSQKNKERWKKRGSTEVTFCEKHRKEFLTI